VFVALSSTWLSRSKRKGIQSMKFESVGENHGKLVAEEEIEEPMKN
jgi:hypothetical protein